MSSDARFNPTLCYRDLPAFLERRGHANWAAQLIPWLQRYFDNPGHGDYSRWRQALDQLPPLDTRLDSRRNVPRFGSDPDDEVPLHRQALNQALLALRPWRKGPLDIGGVLIDSEWRCDWKWQRVAPHLSDLSGRHVLDVGCGNGYYGWRMLGEGAASVIGVDPSLLFLMQWLACRHYAGDVPVWQLPLRLEDLPAEIGGFDSVFSMGVLYHRRAPLAHVQQLRRLLRPGGELVMETLVVMGDRDLHLADGERYARMRNVWCVPRPHTVLDWLRECGLHNARLVDIAATTTAEQRSTAWMPFNSLAEALDETDLSHTVEGHPAPVRAVFIATRPPPATPLTITKRPQV